MKKYQTTGELTTRHITGQPRKTPQIDSDITSVLQGESITIHDSQKHKLQTSIKS